MGQLSHGTWENREPSVLQAISAQNSTLLVAPGPSTSHTADFRNGGQHHCVSWSLRFAQQFTRGEQRDPANPSRLGAKPVCMVCAHEAHCLRVSDANRLTSPRVNTVPFGLLVGSWSCSCALCAHASH